jgi:hypothetical protein
MDDGQPAPYPSLAVRARNGRVADDAGVIAEYWRVSRYLAPVFKVAAKRQAS